MGVEYQKYLIKFYKRVIIVLPHLNIMDNSNPTGYSFGRTILYIAFTKTCWKDCRFRCGNWR